jgi:hypothetical protein
MKPMDGIPGDTFFRYPNTTKLKDKQTSHTGNYPLAGIRILVDWRAISPGSVYHEPSIIFLASNQIKK